MRARYYNPEIKRFINQDVVQGTIENGLSLNRYAYSNGNPISYIDPFGLSPLDSETLGTDKDKRNIFQKFLDWRQEQEDKKYEGYIEAFLAGFEIFEIGGDLSDVKQKLKELRKKYGFLNVSPHAFEIKDLYEAYKYVSNKDKLDMSSFSDEEILQIAKYSLYLYGGDYSNLEGKDLFLQIAIEKIEFDDEIASIAIGSSTGIKIQGVEKPLQIHHFLTNKSKTYTKLYEKIIKKYGLKLKDVWNKTKMPHQGRHPNAYHDYMFERISEIDEVAKGCKDIFLELFEKVKQEIINNPNMLSKNYWR